MPKRSPTTQEKTAARPAKPRDETSQKGRPSIYTAELAERICERVAAGDSLRTIDTTADLPAVTTIVRWLAERPDFRAQYAHAKAVLADHFAEDVVGIPDALRPDADWEPSALVQLAKLQVDARKWAAEKLAPRKYGNKLEIETGASLEDALRQIAEKRGLARG
jgi:hypothetical protein